MIIVIGRFRLGGKVFGAVKRRLILIAVTEPWRVGAAEEELGNALYPYDEGVVVEADTNYPLLYVFSAKLNPIEAFKIVVREPPAYIERLIYVDAIFRVEISCSRAQDLKVIIERVLSDLSSRYNSLREVNVEVKPRSYFVKCREKEASKLVSSELARVGLRVLRKARWTVKLEDTSYGVVYSLIPTGWDRVRYWRERRLGLSNMLSE